MDYQELIAKINTDINANGVGNITGAKLNEVLLDIVATLRDNCDAVHVFISDQDDAATFVWPFEDTDINDVVIEGYDGRNFNDTNKFPKNLMKIGNTGSVATYYDGRGFYGNLRKLEKDNWYYIQYTSADTVNCSIYLKRPNN